MRYEPGIITAIAVALVIGGLAGVGWGFYSENSCQSGVSVNVERLSSDETPPPNFEEVRFEEFSETEQDVFLEILNSESTPIYQDRSSVQGLVAKIVVYRGDRYRTSPMMVQDCSEDWLGFLAGGVLLTTLGGALAVYGRRRKRTV